MNTINIQHYVPVKIQLGNGKVDTIGKAASELGRIALVVFGKDHAKRERLPDRIRISLEKEGIKPIIFDGVESNARAELIYKGSELAKKENVEMIIGVGGGSVIDTAKAISLASTHKGDFWEYRLSGKLGLPAIKDILLPIITVPTTAGTGSEVTPASVVLKDMQKEVLVSSYMFPKIAIIDPQLATHLSPDLTAKIGIDAFVQSIEPYLSIGAQPWSDMFSKEGMRLSWSYLPQCIQKGQDLNSRAMMALSSINGGFAIISAGVGAIHALSAPLSAHFGIPHGYALSLLMMEVLKFNSVDCTERLADIAEILGVERKGLSSKDAADKGIKKIENFLRSIGLYPTLPLRNFGLNEGHLEQLSIEANNPDMTTNPRRMTQEDIIDIYRRLM